MTSIWASLWVLQMYFDWQARQSKMCVLLQNLSYADLMAQLDIANVRELEDFIISECFYPGLVGGKLDQRGQSLHVHQAVPRDVRPEALQGLISGLASWYYHPTITQLKPP